MFVYSFVDRGFLYELASFHTLKQANSAPRNDPYKGKVDKEYNTDAHIRMRNRVPFFRSPNSQSMVCGQYLGVSFERYYIDVLVIAFD